MSETSNVLPKCAAHDEAIVDFPVVGWSHISDGASCEPAAAEPTLASIAERLGVTLEPLGRHGVVSKDGQIVRRAARYAGESDESLLARVLRDYLHPVSHPAEWPVVMAALTAGEPAEPTIRELIVATGLSEDTPTLRALGELTWHVLNPLADAELGTLGAIAQQSDEDLLALPGFGPRRLAALRAELRRVANKKAGGGT